MRQQLKGFSRDGTTDVTFEPMDFIVRLSELAPKPKANSTRFHGSFAPNSHYRVLVSSPSTLKTPKSRRPARPIAFNNY